MEAIDVINAKNNEGKDNGDNIRKRDLSLAFIRTCWT